MSRFAIGFAPATSPNNDTPRAPVSQVRMNAQARVNANVRRQFGYLRGYFAILGFLSLLAAGSLFLALWRLFHFAH